jgi:uncharacterized protein (TIGR02117 family)
VRRWIKRVLGALLLIVAALAALAAWTARPGNSALYPPPASGVSTYDVYVVSHGYHAGIVVRRSEFANRNGNAALAAIVTRFDYEWIEFGWGDEGFYREVPDISALTIKLALKALFLPGNSSVLHVVGLNAEPQVAFYRSQIVRLRLGEESFAKLLGALDAAFARETNGALPGDLGRGLYGPSLFYRAAGAFSILKVCNHWVADILNEAGVPITPVIDTLPQGLLFDLKWRALAVPIR